MPVEQRLSALGIVLPPVRSPIASYVQFRLHGGLLYVSGQGPRDLNGKLVQGKVGRDVTIDEGVAAARLCGLNILSIAQSALGSLDRIDCVLKMLCLINAPPDFRDHPLVANGMSDLFVEVLGDSGRHSRSAIGVASLPHDMAVEVEGVFAIRD